ncbi:FG-GAP-like repeat-containing protein [Vibrio kyushuensis]|uniref:ElyC/SanA/YdcF family protein n=1 Tax=Vibrio kyushuensis TaxID=2910249 RepID=UPI003D132763
MNKNVIAISLFGSLAIGGAANAVENEFSSGQQNRPIDLVINLGLQVNYASCTPRELMEYRVDRVHEVAQSLPNPVIMATGKGNPTSVETCVEQGGLTEAAAIQLILKEKYGWPEEEVILEEISTTTYQNAEQAIKIVDEMIEEGTRIRSMHLVSSHYHIYRGNIDGSDGSAIRDFNHFFGEGTFDHDNSYTSSAFAGDAMWGDSFVAGEWTPANSQVYLADVNGNGRADIVGFKGSEVYVAESKNNRFQKKKIWASNYTPNHAQGWNEEMTRLVGDVNGNGKSELIALTTDGVYVSESKGNKFGEMLLWGDDFSTDNGWNASIHDFIAVDVNGNGLTDLAAFGDDGLYVAFSDGEQFAPVVKVSENFGLDSVIENDGSNRIFRGELEMTNRLLADVNGDGQADVVVYGRSGIYASLQNEDGTFEQQVSWLDNDHGEGDRLDFLGWQNSRYLKTAIDMTGNGRADLANVGNRDLLVAHSNGDRFEYLGGVTAVYTLDGRIPEIAEQWNNFAYQAGWTSESHFRLLGDVTGNGLPDLVGFNDEGIVVSLNENR